MHSTIRAALGFIALGAFIATAAPAAHAQAVRGTLRDADRLQPLPGVRLLLIGDDGAAVDSVRTDRAGGFRVPAPAPGSYTLYFRMDGWASVPSAPIVLTAGADTDFDFHVPLIAMAAIRQMQDILGMEERLQESLPVICGEPFRAWEAGLLIGVVRTRSGRAPVAGARVAVSDADGSLARSTVSSENGVYVLCNVPVGRSVRISIEAPDGTAETTDVEIRPGTASWYDLPIGPRRR